jgi:hypothetical protein
MACSVGNKFRIQSNGTAEISATDDTKDACTAARLLDRLHLDFTKSTDDSITAPTKTAQANGNLPTFWLQIHTAIADFDPTTGQTDRFYKIFTTQTSKDQKYRTAVHAIMNGKYDDAISETEYLKPNAPQTDLSAPDNFKGINGLINLNNVLENLINEKVRTKTGSSNAVDILDDAKHYSKREEIKTTLEEIARRENEIYREKFLNIILVIIGVVFIGTLLSKKFYSGGGGGGGGGGSGLFGNMFTGVGLGSSSGIFSRFGGLGLGRSGRSRLSGLFSSNPYSLTTR